MTRGKKIGATLIAILLVAAAIFFYVKYFYVFGEGAKTGELNYVVKKGYIFKTYEGKMIQSGFQTDTSQGIRSNEFVFSIDDSELAEKLMTGYEGMEVTLRYKEYFGRLPWRGHSKYVVDEILSARSLPGRNESIPLNVQ